MTGPEQVSVNVAALRVIHEWWYGVEDTPDDAPIRLAFFHLFDAIPEPEWEPTDDMLTEPEQKPSELDRGAGAFTREGEVASRVDDGVVGSHCPGTPDAPSAGGATPVPQHRDALIAIDGVGTLAEAKAIAHQALAAIPEPEWEPTDDQEARMLRVWPGLGTLAVRRHLQALHREGLIP